MYSKIFNVNYRRSFQLGTIHNFMLIEICNLYRYAVNQNLLKTNGFDVAKKLP